MTDVISNINSILGLVMAVAFTVNIIVQLTKQYIPVPTKLWAITVSIYVCLTSVYILSAYGFMPFTLETVLFSITGSFLIAYMAMYGFDTFKELWNKFKGGSY